MRIMATAAGHFTGGKTFTGSQQTELIAMHVDGKRIALQRIHIEMRFQPVTRLKTECRANAI
jgi:hypothetical protein